MKKFRLSVMIVITLTFGFILKSNAQKHSGGLYLTSGDYIQHKLSYTTDPANPNGNKINTHDFLEGKIVTVLSNGQTQDFEKSKIFGYRDNANNDYRFFDNKAYKIVDTNEFCIYSYDKLVQQGKGPKLTMVYYFSKKTSDEILALTPENVVKAFPNNTKFRYMVEVAYKSDIKLDAYDDLSHEYKIKELYAESLK